MTASMTFAWKYFTQSGARSVTTSRWAMTAPDGVPAGP
jgi:hypothetical protein